MAILAFVLIAHEPADIVGNSIDMLLKADGECLVTVHYDRNSSSADFADLKRRYGSHARVFLVEDRARCGWGQFGLVDGTLRALRLLAASGKAYTHAYLVSCSCWPIRPLVELRQFLDHNDKTDFIESHDERWMTGGLRKERYTLLHPFSFTRRRRLFEASVRLQRRLGIKRKIPAGLKPRYGSQWWCLRRETVGNILDWVDRNPSACRFYRNVWIPDETFFQTVLQAIGGASAPNGYIPTLYTFNAHGKPIVFYDDHLAWLQDQPYFFARKVAHSAAHCRTVLQARAGLAHPTDDRIVAIPQTVTRALPATRTGPRYGQLFEPKSGVRNWSANFATLNQTSVVLYGPPPLTRRAGEILSAVDGLTVMGRLFRADRIEFQAGQTTFSGLHADETTLRDYDRALYLSRVFSRCAQLPVFELCPGDDPALEKLALETDRNIIILPLLPGGRMPSWKPLFWYLALPELLRAEVDGKKSRPERLRHARTLATRHFGRKHMSLVESKLFGSAAPGGITVGGAGAPIEADWRASFRFTHGASIDPLLAALETVAGDSDAWDWRPFAPALVEQAGEGVAAHG
jgi:hypothetical protein